MKQDTQDSRSRFIPCAYLRVIYQLATEVFHGELDLSHEAQCRSSYAQCVLNATGDELDSETVIKTDGSAAAAWRSKVLTPILQRRLNGVPDLCSLRLRCPLT